MRKRSFVLAALLLIVCSACSPVSPIPASVTTIPPITPIVTASIPSGLKAAGVFTKKIPEFTDLASRFFTGNGPSDLLTTLLPQVDAVIAGLSSTTLSGACLTQAPVSYSITPFGQTIQMWAQCYSTGTPSYTGDPALTQFGTDSDGVIYVYSANAAEWGAFKLTPLSAADAANSTEKYSVEAWIGLGYANASSNCGAIAASTNQAAYPAAWDTCSYGAMHLKANPATKVTELSVAGLGFGYCGIQLVTDGLNISVSGSADMGTTCNALATACFAADAATSGDCTAADLAFTLPSLGRGPNAVQFSLSACNSPAFDQALVDVSQNACNGTTWAISLFPASTPSVVLDGTSTDALNFGPTTPTTGVGLLASH